MMRTKKLSVGKYTSSEVKSFRNTWLKKGYELVDITQLCQTKINCHGYCSEFNEPDENIYHIEIKYRDETICNAGKKGIESLEDDKYVVFGDWDNDFIIFMKVKK